MPTVDAPWMVTAEAELAAGVKELRGPAANPRILEYFAHTHQKGQHTDDSGRDNAWCAAFVSFCLDINKVPNPGAVGARTYEAWGEPCAPFRGAVVVLERNGQKHVAFLAGVDILGRKVFLGGNQGDQVSVVAFPWHQVVAVRKPKGYVVPAALSSLKLVAAGEGTSTV